jgi:hypothetical protein
MDPTESHIVPCLVDIYTRNSLKCIAVLYECDLVIASGRPEVRSRQAQQNLINELVPISFSSKTVSKEKTNILKYTGA